MMPKKMEIEKKKVVEEVEEEVEKKKKERKIIPTVTFFPFLLLEHSFLDFWFLSPNKEDRFSILPW